MTIEPSIAFVTPSYERDRERCELLCASLDRMARFPFNHYILVADHDFDAFTQFAAPHRRILTDATLLPPWLKPMRRPFDRARWIWTSLQPPVWPMSGWHVQQLRKLAIVRHVPEDVLVMVDSDGLFVRPFGPDAFVRDGRVRFFVKEKSINSADVKYGRASWVVQATKAVGIRLPQFPANDYVNNLVSWRRDHALALLERIESRHGRHFAAALGRSRSFSEFQIYGTFVDGVLGRERYFVDEEPINLTYWMGEALDEAGLAAFVGALSPRQIAVAVQSFTGTPTALLRSYLKEREREAYVTTPETT